MTQQKIEHRQDRQLRICLTGGSDITPANADFCRMFGSQIARIQWITIVNGGLDHFKSNPKKVSADLTFIKGALNEIGEDNKGATKLQILTLIPGRDFPNAVRFKAGTTLKLPNHSPQSRRFAMVRYCDAIVTVQGGQGTKGIIDLAVAYEKPMLPLAFTGGESKEAWKTHKSDIIRRFGIPEKIEHLIETTNLISADQNRMRSIATDIVSLLLQPPFVRQPTKRCAVIMPISRTKTCTEEQWNDIFRVIQKCVEKIGCNYKCSRCASQYGNTLITGILGDLDNAEVVIADLTDKNPNVLYELGYRHGRRPNTLMIAQRLEDVPFDLRHRKIIIYGWKTDAERKELCNEIRKVLQWIEEGGRIEQPGSDILDR